MIELRPLGPEWDAAWDALAGNHRESGFMQSSAWARFKELEGYKAARFGLFGVDVDAARKTTGIKPTAKWPAAGFEVDGAAVSAIGSTPAEGHLAMPFIGVESGAEVGSGLWGGASLLTYGGQVRGGMVLCPEGPVLPWRDTERARAGMRLIEGVAQDLAAENGDIGLRIEPHIAPPRPSLLRNWVGAPTDLTPLNTLMLDLTRSDEELRAAMTPKGRYNLGLSRRHGVRAIRSVDLRDVKTFYTLFRDTSMRADFFAEPYGFFLNLGATLFPAGQAALYLAEHAGEVLAAILVVFYGRRATYLYGGSSVRERRVMPNYALHWAALQDARRFGCIEYDFYGYDPFGHPGHQYAGFTRFKTQWGGERRDSIGSHDIIYYDQLADRIVDHVKQSGRVS